MEPVPCPSFEDTFAAATSGAVELAMIPIENSLGGRVADIHHLLPESNLHIVAEHFQSVQHHLLAMPGATLEGIRHIESHAQALAQCRRFVRELGAQPVMTADHRRCGSARRRARRPHDCGDRIRPRRRDLRTRGAARTDRGPPCEHHAIRGDGARAAPAQSDLAVRDIHRVSRSEAVPAALYKALGGFATNGVNITKLESYIVDTSFTVAQFYAEFEGHVEHRLVKLALEELKFFSEHVSILGVYPAHPFRHGTGTL